MMQEHAPHFFKIILDVDFREGRIGMPKKFVKKHGDGLSSPVTVEVPGGAIWQIELSKCDGQVWLEKGWKKFAECYSLSCGSFIVFKYEGHCHFSVIILDRSTSEIEYPSGIVSSLDQNDDRDCQEIERDENEDVTSVETLDVLSPKRNKGGNQSCKIMKTGSTNSGMKVGSSYCSKSKFRGNNNQMTRKKNAEQKVKRRSSNWSSSKAVEAANKFITKHPPFTSVVWLTNTATRATVVSVPVGFSRKYLTPSQRL